jgi:hypothetical protein
VALLSFFLLLVLVARVVPEVAAVLLFEALLARGLAAELRWVVLVVSAGEVPPVL